MEELLAQLIKEITERVTEKVMEDLEEKVNDLLSDYDFADNVSFTDHMSDTVRSEVEDLLRGASISI